MVALTAVGWFAEFRVRVPQPGVQPLVEPCLDHRPVFAPEHLRVHKLVVRHVFEYVLFAFTLEPRSGPDELVPSDLVEHYEERLPVELRHASFRKAPSVRGVLCWTRGNPVVTVPNEHIFEIA